MSSRKTRERKENEVTIRLWLKDDALPGGFLENEGPGRPFMQQKIQLDPLSGMRYIDAEISLADEGWVISSRLQDHVMRVTVREQIARGLRLDGRYFLPSHATTRLSVRTELRRLGETYAEVQNLSISAPRVDLAWEIYRQFRLDMLQPTEYWEPEPLKFEGQEMKSGPAPNFILYFYGAPSSAIYGETLLLACQEAGIRYGELRGLQEICDVKSRIFVKVAYQSDCKCNRDEVQGACPHDLDRWDLTEESLATGGEEA